MGDPLPLETRPHRTPVTRTVTVVSRDQVLSERVRADLCEQGIHPVRELAGHNAALVFQSNVAPRDETRYTEGWALQDASRPFVFPRWHAWATVYNDRGEHVIDITPGWFGNRHTLYAPLYTYGIIEALDYGKLPIHGEGPVWMHHPMDWPTAPGVTIQVTSFEPPEAA